MERCTLGTEHLNHLAHDELGSGRRRLLGDDAKRQTVEQLEFALFPDGGLLALTERARLLACDQRHDEEYREAEPLLRRRDGQVVVRGNEKQGEGKERQHRRSRRCANAGEPCDPDDHRHVEQHDRRRRQERPERQQHQARQHDERGGQGIAAPPGRHALQLHAPPIPRLG